MKTSKSTSNQGNKFRYRYAKSGYGMIAPACILLFVFAYIPLFMAIIRSFQDYATGEFIGFENYDYILKTPTFTKAFGNIVLFTAIIVVAQMILSFFFAYVLKSINVKVANAVKILIYVPCLLSGVVASIMFMFILNYGGGLRCCTGLSFSFSVINTIVLLHCYAIFYID